MPKLTVLMSASEVERFDAYCREKGYKKSPLVVRLIREHLTREGFALQRDLSLEEKRDDRSASGRRRG